MGKATGAFLILAGLGTAALVLPAIDKDAERQLSDVVRMATGTTPPLAVPAPVPASSQIVKATALPQPLADKQPAPSNPPSNPIATAATVPAQPPVAVVAKSVVPSGTRSDASESRSAGLIQEIQRELKRVGCYDGDVSGEWSPATKKAMKTFVDRVNATLPVDAPDHILKTLVHGHPGGACGVTCPAGQSLSADARCVPTAVLAQRDNLNTKKRVALADDLKPRSSTPKTPAAPVTSETTSETRQAPEIRATDASSWRTSSETAALPPPLPAPLPGRMAIGGPRTESAIPAQPAASPRLEANETAAPSARRTAAIAPQAVEQESRDTPRPAPKSAATPRADRRAPPAAAYRAPPPVIRYASPSWSPPVRRFGPHIFQEQARWGR